MCKAPLLAVVWLVVSTVPAIAQDQRPTVGVAFGGGSARGIAHVGVIKWFEEHHIPIDLSAGTSMGGLIGGAFATGMDSAELEDMLKRLNWDELFGASTFAFKNIRRKADAKAYPSRLEFGLRRGIVPPAALNNGEQIDLLVGRITAPYYGVRTFDELPTPFRAVAVDLLSATTVVLDRGPLASALRATMSLPLIFPPVPLDGRVLVDGGLLNNVPADVMKSMGASRIVAVNVGDLTDLQTVNQSLLGVAGQSLDAMMRASTKISIRNADVIVNVPLAGYGSLDWRRSADLIGEGYKAAESMRESLLPLAIGAAEYAQWQAGRQARRRTMLPAAAFVRAEGFSRSDEGRLLDVLGRHVGVAFDIDGVQTDLAALSGLDRYETVTWRIVDNAAGDTGLLVTARPKPYGPPFLMMGLSLENTTSDDFRLTLTARYLAYDVVGSGSELRVDGALGSDPGVGAELYRPIGASPLFVAPYAGVYNRTLSLIDNDAVVARYGQRSSRVGVNLGVNLGASSDLRFGTYVGRLNAHIDVGNPGLPEVNGSEGGIALHWRYNGQDSAVVPSRGSAAYTTLRRVLASPDISPPLASGRTNVGVTQLSGEMNTFRTVRERDRMFVVTGGGTSFAKSPLPTDQFPLGSPLHLGAYSSGEIRGDHYYVATAGYLRQIGRLPDFMGGAIHAGAWLENGDAFDRLDAAAWRTHASVGVIMDTLVGPVILAGAAGFDGRWRTYVGVGRIFGSVQ